MASRRVTAQMEQADFLICEHLLKEFRRFKHRKYVRSFKEPVDTVAVPNYLNIIREPMDLSTIASKLENNAYDSAAAFKADFELMFANCETFNAGHPPSPVFEQGRQFHEQFDQEWMEQNNWLRRVHPEVFNERRLREQEESINEPPAKKPRRQSSRLVAPSESSPGGPSPYTSASVMTTSTSTPVTPVAPLKKRAPKASGSKSTVTNTVPLPSTLSQPAITQHATTQAAEHQAALIHADSNMSASSPLHHAATQPETNIRTPWENFQKTLKGMVAVEATAMLNDSTIKLPAEDNKLAHTLWQSMNSETTEQEDEEGKASFKAWVELAVEELTKVAIRDVGDHVQTVTKKALVVIMDRHWTFLRNKLDAFHIDLKARLEG